MASIAQLSSLETVTAKTAVISFLWIITSRNWYIQPKRFDCIGIILRKNNKKIDKTRLRRRLFVCWSFTVAQSYVKINLWGGTGKSECC